ncbi:MAG: hypothetical protein WAK17_08025 [Candidatus Nitrosopolaris sp.]|jgi:predicted RNase H-like HicB family nuclease
MTGHEHEHHLQYHCHRGVTGEYIGQFVEFPRVIVHAPTKEEVKTRIIHAFHAYLKAFPKEHDRISELKDAPIMDEVVITD